MSQFALTWIAAICFSALVLWGSNVPTEKRTPIVIWFTCLMVFLQIVTQSYLFKVDASPMASPDTRQTAEQALQSFQLFLRRMALPPGFLQESPIRGWYRIISSSVLHYGWLHLLYNVWFFVLFGHVIEHTVGSRKFLVLLGCGLVIPPALDGLYPVGLSGTAYTGGLSGVVYTLMGAYLVMFPRSRSYGAVIYDLRFWGAIFFILLPVTMITRLAGMALTETVLIMGATAAFLLLQPENSRISLPVVVVVLIKLLQDVVFIQPAIHDVLSNSFWRIGGGLLLGGILGYAFNGVRGWNATWEDVTRLQRTGPRYGSSRTPIAKLESEGRNSLEAARVYLGQRVFVGDAERAATFYKEVVIPKFPDLLLPIQEQMALARLLHFKGRDAESLHAYETLVNHSPKLPDEYWIAWLKAAELTMKLFPDETAQVRRYLNEFQQGNMTMLRDRIEAERLQALLPVNESDESADARSTLIGDNPTVEQTESAEADQWNMVPESSKKRRGGEEQADLTSVEFPKLTPRTFQYMPGSAPVSHRKVATNTNKLPTLADPEFLNTYWKPLPSMGERQPTNIMERRIKNNCIVEEEDKPTLYAGSKNDSGPNFRIPSRLGNLEISSRMAPPEATVTSEMPGQYGGLGDVVEIQDYVRLRLRGEDNSDLSQTPRPRRQRAHSSGYAEASGSEKLRDFYGEAESQLGAASAAESSLNSVELIEVFGLVMSDSGCLFKTAFGSRRIAWDEIRVISIGRMKLTATSQAQPRLLLEFLVSSGSHRYQLFERTLLVKGSTVAGVVCSAPDELLLKAWEYTKLKALKAQRMPAEIDAPVPQYVSYNIYNQQMNRLHW